MSESLGPPWTVACQAPLSMGFSRLEYWSVLLFPTPGDHPDPGVKPVSPACPESVGRFFTTEPAGKAACKTADYIKQKKGSITSRPG